MIAGSPIRSIISLVPGSSLSFYFQAWFPSSWSALITKMLVITKTWMPLLHLYAIILPYWSFLWIMGTKSGWITVYFFLLRACLELTKVFREEAFRSDSALILWILCLTNVVSLKFMGLTFNLQSQPKALATEYIILGVSLILLTNNSKGFTHRC